MELMLAFIDKNVEKAILVFKAKRGQREKLNGFDGMMIELWFIPKNFCKPSLQMSWTFGSGAQCLPGINQVLGSIYSPAETWSSR